MWRHVSGVSYTMSLYKTRPRNILNLFIDSLIEKTNISHDDPMRLDLNPE